MTYASTILADSPVAFWRLNEAAGATTVADSSGNGHTGTVVGATLGTASIVVGDAGGTSMTTGANAGFTVPASSAFNFPSGGFSYEFWIKTAASGAEKVVMSCGGTANNSRIDLDPTGHVSIPGTSGATGGTAVNTGAAKHVVVSVAATSRLASIYVNGTLDNSPVAIPAYGDSANPLIWGYFDQATNFGIVGQLQDCAIYAAALTSSQVQAHYLAGSTAGAATAVTVSPTTASVAVGNTTLVSVSHNGTSAADTITATPSAGATVTPTTATVTGTGTATFTLGATTTGSKTVTFASSLGLTSAIVNLTATSGTALVLVPNLGDCIAVAADSASVTATTTGGLAAVTYAWHLSSTPNFTPDGTTLTSQTSATAVFSGLTPGVDKWAVCIASDGTTSPQSFHRLVSISGLSPLRVGFVGDSTSSSTNMPSYINGVSGSVDRHAQNYLRSRMGNRKVSTVNVAIAGTSTSDWQPGGANLNSALASFSAAGFVANDWIIVRLGVNDAQGHVSASTFRANLAALVGALTSANYRVQVDYPTWREPGQFIENTSITFDESTTPYLYAYYPQIDSLVNGTTIFPGDKVSARNFATAPTLYMNRSSTYPGGIHPIVDGAIEFGMNTAEALMINSGLIGAGGTFPIAAQVLNGIQFGPTNNLTGNVVLPTAAQVQSGVAFGPAGVTVGTYTSGSSGTFPTASQVLLGITFGPTNNLVGNVVLPSFADVRLGTVFGPNGLTVGTLPSGGFIQPTGTRAVLVTVTDRLGNVIPNASFQWAWFDEARPQTLNHPTDQGPVATTNAAGVLSLTVHSALAAGATGSLILSTTDGTIATVANEFFGPVRVQ